jgi:YD repeat-containing protein
VSPSRSRSLYRLAGGHLQAQTSTCANHGGYSFFKTNIAEATTNLAATCGSGLYRCYEVEELDRTIRLTNPACDPNAGSCEVELVVTLRYPGNRQNFLALMAQNAPNAVVWWYDGGTPPTCDPTTSSTCSQQAVGVCGAPLLDARIKQDRVETFLRIDTSCENLRAGILHPRMGEYSILAYPCSTASSSACRLRKAIGGLSITAEAVAAAIDCPIPRIEECEECLANVGDGEGDVPVGGDAACVIPGKSGPKATLRYTGRGAGYDGLPGTDDWQPLLGRNWGHDYAERIVLDPDDSHVWLITRHATFREFSGLSGGVYTTVSPSDEYRTLERTGTGWALTELDGMVTEFDGAGLWLSTTDRNGNAKIGTYNLDGQLTSVDFPDGRREDFGYDGGGRLTSIAEVGTDGVTTRTWTYTWSGDDLARIDRPDGTAWVMTYGDALHPGYLTLLELEGTDGTSRRVEQGWQYDAHGNAVRTWRGASTFGDPAAVDEWELSFDDPLEPTETTVIDPLGQTILYTVGRDTVSDKPRVEAIQDGCPGCGLESDTVFVYGAEHPLLPIQQTDAEGNVTTFTYTASGQVATRTEAANEPLLARTTTFSYDLDFPALVTEIEQPSTAGGANVRRTEITRDTTTPSSARSKGSRRARPSACRPRPPSTPPACRCRSTRPATRATTRRPSSTTAASEISSPPRAASPSSAPPPSTTTPSTVGPPSSTRTASSRPPPTTPSTA